MNEPHSGWPLSGSSVALLAHRLADPLHDRAMRLTVDDHRIDAAADVVDAGVAHDFISQVSGSISTSQIAVPLGNTGSCISLSVTTAMPP